jgi:hypothetical protein
MNPTRRSIRLGLVLVLACFSACEKHLDRLNQNPNGVDPAGANPNLMLPTVLTGTALSYLNLGYGDIGGVVQHTQKDGWYGGHNHYDWGPQDWSGWYNLLRNNEFLYRRSVEQGFKFHQGVALTMRAFLFGTVADLWGDVPYSKALQGDKWATEFTLPAFDSQEVIYKGVIEDLKAASALFAANDNTGVSPEYDVFYAGRPADWRKFSQSLLLRYALRVSGKLPDLARSTIEGVYTSGVYLKSASEDATMGYIGATAGDSWPTATAFDAGSNFRRLKPGQAFVEQLLRTQDPRLPVWIEPVHVRWVPDPALSVGVEPFIRRDGVVQNGVRSLTDAVLVEEVRRGVVFTRHYNPTLRPDLNPGRYVGVPAGLLQPDTYNGNPTPGQVVENQHVSQLSRIYRERNGALLRARLMSAAETHFILAEAALKGYAVGSAETHYNAGVKSSLDTWGVGAQYATFISRPAVAYNQTLARIMEQKWVAGWTAATEAWFDYRRTGLPALRTGEASPEPVLPLRFNYGDNELNFNAANTAAALDRLEVTPHSGLRGKNSPWSKPWLLQGTGKPW